MCACALRKPETVMNRSNTHAFIFEQLFVDTGFVVTISRGLPVTFPIYICELGSSTSRISCP